MQTNNQMTLTKLSKQLKCNKSKLHYYVSMGLLKPVLTFGKTLIFNKDEVLKQMKKIGEMKKEGLTLKKMKSKI